MITDVKDALAKSAKREFVYKDDHFVSKDEAYEVYQTHDSVEVLRYSGNHYDLCIEIEGDIDLISLMSEFDKILAERIITPRLYTVVQTDGAVASENTPMLV